MRISSAMKALSLVVVCGAFVVGPQVRAQEDYRAIVTIMRACSQIADTPARVMCYDNNIRPGDASAGNRADTPAAPMQSPPAPARVAAQGFGGEMLSDVRRAERAEASDAITAQVAAIEPLEPGIYLLTLADGAQWRFVDAAPNSWSPPRPGDEIELERGSLGSVFLKYDDQRRLRVRRVR